MVESKLFEPESGSSYYKWEIGLSTELTPYELRVRSRLFNRTTRSSSFENHGICPMIVGDRWWEHWTSSTSTFKTRTTK